MMPSANTNAPALSLAGRKALITGGASGIGQAAARVFAALGADVAIADIDAAALEAVVAQTGARTGIRCDVADAQDVAAAVEKTLSALGGLDTVLHCAGIAHVSPALEQDMSAWQRVMDINVKGTHLVCCAAAAHMVKHGGGSITTISSVSGHRGYPRRGAYGTSKAAVRHLTQTLACEWGRDGIRVNTISPGYIHTAMIDELSSKGLVDLERIKGRTPLHRLGAPEEIARAAAFLASDWASYVTGADFCVDGGWSAFGGSGEVASF